MKFLNNQRILLLILILLIIVPYFNVEIFVGRRQFDLKIKIRMLMPRFKLKNSFEAFVEEANEQFDQKYHEILFL